MTNTRKVRQFKTQNIFSIFTGKAHLKAAAAVMRNLQLHLLLALSQPHRQHPHQLVPQPLAVASIPRSHGATTGGAATSSSSSLRQLSSRQQWRSTMYNKGQ
jgi:hypothetical protein